MASESLNTALEDILLDLRQRGPMLSMFHSQLLRRGLYVPYRVLVDKDAGHSDLSDHRLSFLTEDDALSKVVEALEKIGCYQEANRLKSAMETRGQPLMSGAEGSLPSEEHIVDQIKDQLINTVRDMKPILDELLTKGVIQQESYDKISALPTSEEKMRELLDVHLKTVEGKDILFNKCFPVCYQGPSTESVESGGNPWSSVKVLSARVVRINRVMPSSEVIWIKLEPEVNCVGAEDAPTYSLQSEAGNFECSVSGLRWVCKEMVSLKYQFGSWEEHMERLKSRQYIPGGPLLDITVIAGKLDEAYLPHWICTDPTTFNKFAVLHIDDCGDVVEQVSEVTTSHVKLADPIFSPRGVLMKAGFPVRINCKVLIYKTSKAFLTLHVYLIPRDPALQQSIKNKESSSGYTPIEKPYPVKSLKMRDRFILTADVDRAEIYPEKLKLVYECSDPNFFEVFIAKPDSHFQLTLKHESVLMWTCAIRTEDYQNTGDIGVQYEEELFRLRPKLVEKMSRELINQLLDHLLKDRVLSNGEKDSILQENSTCADRARCLIDMVKNKGREASRKIFTHLQSRDPTLSAELRLPSGRPV